MIHPRDYRHVPTTAMHDTRWFQRMAGHRTDPALELARSGAVYTLAEAQAQLVSANTDQDETAFRRAHRKATCACCERAILARELMRRRVAQRRGTKP